MTAAGDEHSDDVERIFDERRAALASPVTARDDTNPIPLLIVEVGDQHVALPVVRTRELVPPGPIARVPGGGALVGVRAVRGEILAVADVSQLLEMDSATPASQRWVAVLGDAGDAVGLLIDAPVDLVDVPRNALAEQSNEQLLTSHVTADGIPVVDVDALLTDPRVDVEEVPPTPLTGPGEGPSPESQTEEQR